MRLTLEVFPMTKLLTVTDIATFFGVRAETVHSWARSGRIPCIRPSKKTIRFRLEDVVRALERPSATT